MNAFFRYFLDFFIALFANIGDFLYTAFVLPWTTIGTDFTEYQDILNSNSADFGVIGWILCIFSWILLVGIFGILIYRLFRLLRRYFRFVKTEKVKDELVEQIEMLNDELYKATQEKNKILNIKFGELGMLPSKKGTTDPNTGETTYSSTDNTENGISPDCRFTKLASVDKKYFNVDTAVNMPDNDLVSLDQLVDRFRLFAASQLGLFYDKPTMRAFIASLGTTKVIILEGISGTGKTSLPYAFGKFIQNNSNICSVQPNWRDRAELLGYFNEFTKKFNETDFLKYLYEATYREDLNVIILDEMNLARIEYYFAEFLSIMEMPDESEWKIDLISSPNNTDPKHIIEGKLLVPQNVWFIGTANNDDSTFTITDKVYDRAMTIEFRDKGKPFQADYTEPITISYDYLHRLFTDAIQNYPISAKTLEKFGKLDDFVIAKFKLAFGNRLLKQMRKFVPNYVACGGTELEAVDYVFATKILRKFESLNITFMKDELRLLIAEIEKLFGKSTFPASREYIEQLIKNN